MVSLVVSETELRDDRVLVTGHRHRHLFRARRLTTGDALRVVDGAGSARSGTVIDIGPERATIALGESIPANESSRHIELLAPIPKGSRLSWMVEKSTEVGASAIRLLRTERGPRKIGVGTLARLRRVAIAAVEQSHRSVVPKISGPHGFDELPELLRSLPERWVLQPGAESAEAKAAGERAALLVGPEGGWAPDELQRLEELACRPLDLGPTVLRIETAAVVGCAALLAQDWST